MKFVPLIFLIFLLSLDMAAYAGEDEVKKYVDQLAVMLADNDAELVDNNIEIKELCLDAKASQNCYEFALFNLEGFGGGNGTWATYLVLFTSIDPAFNPLNLGNIGNHKNYQLLDFKIISDDRIGNRFSLDDTDRQKDTIILRGKGYKDKDPECCPTKPVVMRFTVENQKIVILDSNVSSH